MEDAAPWRAGLVLRCFEGETHDAWRTGGKTGRHLGAGKRCDCCCRRCGFRFGEGCGLVFAEDAASAEKALTVTAGAVVLKRGCVPAYATNATIAIVEADQPRLWFARAARCCSLIVAATGFMFSAGWVPGFARRGSQRLGPARLSVTMPIGAGTRIEAGAVIGEGVRDWRRLPDLSAGCALSGDDAGQPGGGSCGRGAGRGWVWVRARREDRRVYAVSAAGHVADRRRCGDWRELDYRSRGAEADTDWARNEDRQPGARGAQLRHRRGRDSGGADRHFGLVDRGRWGGDRGAGGDWRPRAPLGRA